MIIRKIDILKPLKKKLTQYPNFRTFIYFYVPAFYFFET